MRCETPTKDYAVYIHTLQHQRFPETVLRGQRLANLIERNREAFASAGFNMAVPMRFTDGQDEKRIKRRLLRNVGESIADKVKLVIGAAPETPTPAGSMALSRAELDVIMERAQRVFQRNKERATGTPLRLRSGDRQRTTNGDEVLDTTLARIAREIGVPYRVQGIFTNNTQQPFSDDSIGVHLTQQLNIGAGTELHPDIIKALFWSQAESGLQRTPLCVSASQDLRARKIDQSIQKGDVLIVTDTAIVPTDDPEDEDFRTLAGIAAGQVTGVQEESGSRIISLDGQDELTIDGHGIPSALFPTQWQGPHIQHGCDVFKIERAS